MRNVGGTSDLWQSSGICEARLYVLALPNSIENFAAANPLGYLIKRGATGSQLR
jgi:hypothetical protein